MNVFASDRNPGAASWTWAIVLLLGSTGLLSAADTTPPTITSRTTLDTDGNGQIDRIRLVFSEAIDDTTVQASDFAVSSYTVSGIDSGTANDQTLFLLVTGKGVADSGVRPPVGYTQSGSVDLADLAGNLLTNDASAIIPSDGAAPLLLRADVVVGGSRLVARFSEPVYTTSGGSGVLLLSDFTFTDPPPQRGATSLSAIDDADGSDDTASFTTNAAVVASDIGSDSLAVATTTSVYDASGNPAGTTAVLLNQVDLATGLGLHWRLDEGSGTAVADASGSGRTGTTVNAPAWATGRLDQGILLNGVDQGVNSDAAFEVGTAFSISAWVHLESTSPSQINTVLANNNWGGTDSGYRLMINSFNTTDRSVWFGTANGTVEQSVSSNSGVISSDTWHHLAAVCDRSAGTVTIYVDGKGVATGSVRTDFLTSDLINLGRMGSGHPFDGTIDDARIYTRLLSAGDVSELAVLPRITAVTTGDADGNGRIDRLTLGFDRPVTITDAAGDGFPGLTVSGYTIANADYSGTGVSSLVVTLIESGSLDGAATPEVGFVNPGSIIYPATSQRCANLDTTAATDGVAPVLLKAESITGSDLLTAVFSEPVYSTAAGSGLLVTADFAYGDISAGGATTLGTVSDGRGVDRAVSVYMDSAFVLGDFGSDTLAPDGGGGIYDAAGNLASASSVTISQVSAATLYWHDLLGDGNANDRRNYSTDQAGTSPAAIGSMAADTVLFAGTGPGADNPATLSSGLVCAALDATGYAGTLSDGGFTLAVGGNLTLVTGMTLTATGTLAMDSGGTVTSAGRVLNHLSSTAGTLVMGDNLTVGGTFSKSGGTWQWSSPIFSLSRASANHSLAASVTLALDSTWNIGASDSRLLTSGVVSDGASTFGITKTGAGALELSGANTYDGSTAVNAGSLVVSNASGSATGTGTVTVASGGTLAGTGSMAGLVTVADGGAIAPGDGGTGTLTFNGGLSMAATTTSAWNVQLGTSSDQIVVNGNLTLDGVVNSSDAGGLSAGTYTIATYTGTLTNNTLSVGTLPPGLAATVDTSTVGTVDLVVVIDYSAWTHSTTVAFNTTASGANVAGNVSNFPLLIRLDSTNFDFSQALSDGADLRFTDPDGSNLPYEIEAWDATAQQAEIWVLVPQVDGNSSSDSITMYWGKSDASSRSNGNAVFTAAGSHAGVWHLQQDPTGGNGALADSSVAVNHATLQAAASGDSVAAVVDNGLQLDGSSKYLSTTTAHANPTVFTTSIWFKTTTTGGKIMGFDSAQTGIGGNYDRHTYMANDGTVHFGIFDGMHRVLSTTGTYNDGAWHQVAARVSGAGSFLYLDGVQVTGDATFTTPENYTGYWRAGLGGLTTWPNEPTSTYFGGSLDEFRVIHAASSNDFIKLSYETQKPGTTALALDTTATWDGGGIDANWDTAANWDGDAMPGPSDSVVSFGSAFTSGSTIGLNGNRSINTLEFTTGNHITFDSTVGTNTLSLRNIQKSSGELRINSNIALTGDGVWASSGGYPNIHGVISGTHGITLTSGRWNLYNANTFSGGLIIEEGSGVTAYDSSLGTGLVTVRTGYQNVSLRAGDFPNGFHFDLPIWIDLFGPNTSGNVITLSGVMSGTLNQSVHLSPQTGNTMIFSGTEPNTWTGDTNRVVLYHGTLQLDKDGAFGTVASVSLAPGWAGYHSELVIGQPGVTCDRVLNCDANHVDAIPIILGGVNTSGTTTFSGTLSLNSNNYNQHLKLTAASGGRCRFSGVLNDGANTYLVEKIGAGSVELSSANTYDGGTTLTAGTLVVSNSSGSATGTGAVTIASGSTLAGTGSMAGLVTVADGGSIAPGDGGAGTLTFNGGLSMSATTTSAWNLGLGTASDLIAINGALTLDGVVNVTNSGGIAAGSYTIATYTGTLTDNTLTVGTLPAGFGATVSTSTAGQVDLVVTEDYGNWTHSAAISFDTTASGFNVVGTVVDFPMLLRFDNTNFTFSQALSNGADIRFADPDGTPLPYEIEAWDAAAQRAEVWVLVPQVDGNSAIDSITMYWGKSDAVSESDGSLVFTAAASHAGVWHLHQDPPVGGGALSDSSAAANHGTLQDPASGDRVSTIIDNGIQLNGSTKYISTTTAFTNPSVFTVSIWFKTTTTAGGKLIGFEDLQTGSSVSRDRHLWMADAGTLHFGIYDGSIRIISSTGSYNDGSWHLATARTSSAGTFLYVDGVQVAGNAAYTTPQNFTGYWRAGYGNMQYWEPGPLPTSYFFNGSIDEFRVVHAAHSADFIKLSYETQKLGVTAGIASGSNSAPGQVALSTPIHCPDAGTAGPADDLIATYGRTLDTTPPLIWNIPADADADPLHFQVFLDSTAGTTQVADSSTSQTGFEYHNGSTWAAFPIGGATPGSGQVRYTPQSALATNDDHFWTVQAHDGTVAGAAATVRRFLVATRNWTDGTLSAAETRIRKIHLDELREETDYARKFRNLADVTWTDATITVDSTPIKKTHLDELRSGLEAVRSISGGGATIGADPLSAWITRIRSSHFTELRAALLDL